MKRPVVWLAVFALCSVVLCAFCGFAAAALFAAAATAVSAVALRKNLVALLLIGTISVIFAARFVYVKNYADKLCEKYNGVEALLVGEVYSAPDGDENGINFILKTKIGLIDLMSYSGIPDGLCVGDTVRVPVKLTKPKTPDNDYELNYENYYRGRRIYLTASLKGELVCTGHRTSLRSVSAYVRNLGIAAGERFLIGDELALYCAVVFGDKSGMSGELRDKLAAAGLSHIAAVSGMHLSVVSVIVMFLLLHISGKRRISNVIVIAAMIFFAFVTGGSDSVVRSCIMNVIFQLSRILYHEADNLTSLSVAVIIMLAVNPFVFFSTAFCLSVTATLGIVLFSTPIYKLIDKIIPLPVLKTLISVSMGAQLVTFPLTAYIFNRVATYALISNILVVPFLTPIMSVGLLMAALGRVPLVGAALGVICKYAFGYIAFVAEKISSLPYSTIAVGKPSVAAIFAYCFALLSLYAAAKKRFKGFALLGACALLSVCVVGVENYRKSKTTDVVFLNVGRADCTLISVGGKTDVLVDGGRDGSYAYDYLDARGVGRLDCAIATSDASEHAAGLISLVSNGKVERLYLPNDVERKVNVEFLCQAAEIAGTRVYFYSVGDALYIDGIKLNFLESDGKTTAISASASGLRLLLCGDSPMAWEGCDIVKIPCHDKEVYTYTDEIKKYTPKYAVITASKASSAEGTIKALENEKTEYYVPADCGTVTFSVRNGKISVKTTKPVSR